jgi:hypothetical protein
MLGPFTECGLFQLQYLSSLIENGAACTHEIISRIALVKAVNKKEALFTSIMELIVIKRLVKFWIWSIALFGAETWTRLNVDEKYRESFEMCCWTNGEDQLDRSCEKLRSITYS